ESIRFQNFKALRDTKLLLGRFTLIVGPNGSGKSTALQAFKAVAEPRNYSYRDVATAGLQSGEVKVEVYREGPPAWIMTGAKWSVESANNYGNTNVDDVNQFANYLARTRLYSFDAQAIASPAQLMPNVELAQSGSNLAVVLDQLRDHHPERFDELNNEMGRLLPEFDRILFDTP